MTETGKEDFLLQKLAAKKENDSFRSLPNYEGKIDFCSNDYLGFSKLLIPFQSSIHQYSTGSTGSRLISGNSILAEETEKKIAAFHQAESALIFNCGYMANVGLFSSVVEKNDVVIHDEFIHASIIDGIKLSNGKRFKFLHNDVIDLEKKIIAAKKDAAENIFVAIESIYSMDGDSAPLQKIVEICEKYNTHLIVDEAHVIGILGEKGEGLVSNLNLQNKVFATVVTFGKAMGLHGAAVLGSNTLRDYLINFSRAFIFTTALPPHNYLLLQKAYELLPNAERKKLFELINYFKTQAAKIKKYDWKLNDSPIQILLYSDKRKLKSLAETLNNKGFGVKAILSPTVKVGEERIRICLHSFNTKNEIDLLLEKISHFKM